MKFFTIRLINFIYVIPLTLRRLVLILIDAVGITLCLYFANFLVGYPHQELIYNRFYILITASIGVIIFLFTGQYKGVTRYVGTSALYRLLLRNLIFISIINLIYFFVKLEFFTFKFNFNFLLLLTFLNSFIRFFLRDFLFFLSYKNKENIAIYGAQEESIQLASAIEFSSNYQLLCFVDNNKLLKNRYLNSIPVLSVDDFNKKFSNKSLKKILIPNSLLEKSEKFALVNKFNRSGLNVIRVPTLKNMISGDNLLSSLKPISIADLLGRESVKPQENLLGPGIKNFSVLITGAGGTIGSELSRLILKLEPKKLILLDQSEHNLYEIDKSIRKEHSTIEIQTVLGSCLDRNLLRELFKIHDIDVVYHAAAYKHVPLVEKNPISGIYNNVFSTKIICETALEFNIKQFILISTDKAVRPTNIMGASKRLAELIVQSYSGKNNNNDPFPIFSSVRFGNVLGSSGSVIPLFKEQIKNGGPITLTDKEVTRYFMTISEAAELVVQSSVLAEGGDVFILDMGEPVKIIDLAEQMIYLSGLTVKDEKNLDGQIEILITGLRNGEKLYEELLIGESSSSTVHPLIFKANEKFIKYSILEPKLNELRHQLEDKNITSVKAILKEIVPEWNLKN